MTEMTKQAIFAAAMAQSARDLGCRPDDFFKREPLVVPLHMAPDAKKYYELPIACNFVSYGCNVVAAAEEEYRPLAEEYVGKFAFYHCFETPAIHWLDSRLAPLGQKVCFMAEYFLPDPDRLRPLDCGFAVKRLERDDFSGLYLPQWSNALCEKRKQLDVLGMGAYDGDTLIGLAGCSADAQDMLQIGIDVLPEYRNRGVACALTSHLAAEILKRGKVPFYCCAWSNIASARNAIKSGFTPAWAEMTVKPQTVIDAMNE